MLARKSLKSRSFSLAKKKLCGRAVSTSVHFGLVRSHDLLKATPQACMDQILDYVSMVACSEPVLLTDFSRSFLDHSPQL